jgi:hypothetical protein
MMGRRQIGIALHLDTNSGIGIRSDLLAPPIEMRIRDPVLTLSMTMRAGAGIRHQWDDSRGRRGECGDERLHGMCPFSPFMQLSAACQK